MGTHPSFSAIPTKSNNFHDLFDSLEDKFFLKSGHSLKEFALQGEDTLNMLQDGHQVRRQAKMNKAELLPLKMYMLTLLKAY